MISLLVHVHLPGFLSDWLSYDIAILSALAFVLVTQDATSLDIPFKHDLPVLYEEDGKEVLRFSELLGYKDKRNPKCRVFRGELM